MKTFGVISRKWMIAFTALGSLLCSTGQHPACAATIVVPPANAATEGSLAFGLTTPLTAQQVYGASILAGIPNGAIIDGFRVRLNAGESSGPSAMETVTNFDVYIGPSAFAPGSLSSSTAGNEGPGTVLARSGSLTIAPNSFSGGNSPNAFGPLISFTSPYTYTGGNLLLTLSFSNFSSGLLVDGQRGMVDAQERQDNGYNSSTVAFDAGSYALIVQFDFASSVPEPSTGVLAVLGIGGIVGYSSRLLRRRARG